MSTVFDLDTEGQRVQDEQANLNPLSPDAVQVPTFYRTNQAIGNYAMAGFARSARAGMLALSVGPIAYDAATGGTKAQDSWFETMDDYGTDAVKYWTPGAQETGSAGRLLGGVAQMLTSLTAGGVSGLAATEGLNTGLDLVDQGVGSGTAIGASVIQAATMGVGGMLPGSGIVAGKLADFALAAGGNVGLGLANRGGLNALLSANGYEAQAQQYKAFDAASIAADLVMGSAFWGLSRRFSQPQVDAALTQRNAQNAQVDIAPGVPIDAVSSVSHQEALRTALDQISRGEPVNLPPRIMDAGFLRSGDEAAPMAPSREVAETAARQELEPAYRAELDQQASQRQPNVADLKQEVAEMQRTLDGLDDSFKDRAKQFQQQGQGRKAAEASARDAIAQDRQTLTDRQGEINSALDMNRQAEQAGAELGRLNRGEPSEVLNQRVQARADEMAKAFEKTPLASGVASGNQLSFRQIARQEIGRALGDIDREQVPHTAVADDGLAGMPRAARESIDQPEPAVQQDGQNAQQSGAKAQQDGQEAQQNPADVDPEVQLAQGIVDHMEDLQLPTGAIDAEGRPVTVSAKQLLAEADAQLQQAQSDTKGFLAAAACFLQRGES